MMALNLFNITVQLNTIILLLLLSMGLSNCAGKAPLQSNGAAPALPLLQFQRAPCYGTCPAYEATILKDGSITLVSWGHISVPENDTVQLHMPKPELDKLKADIAALNYTLLEDAYLTRWTDWPSTYLTFYEDGKAVKRIKHQEGGPEALKNLHKELHETIMALLKDHPKKH